MRCLWIFSSFDITQWCEIISHPECSEKKNLHILSNHLWLVYIEKVKDGGISSKKKLQDKNVKPASATFIVLTHCKTFQPQKLLIINTCNYYIANDIMLLGLITHHTQSKGLCQKLEPRYSKHLIPRICQFLCLAYQTVACETPSYQKSEMCYSWDPASHVHSTDLLGSKQLSCFTIKIPHYQH